MNNTTGKKNDFKYYKIDSEYDPTTLYPLIIDHQEFALVTGEMLNEINREINKILKFNTNPTTIKITPEEWNWQIKIPELERKMISKTTN